MKHKIKALNPLTYSSCGGGSFSGGGNGSFSGGGDSGLFCLGEALVQGVSPCSAEDPAMARCGAHGKIRPVVLPSGS
ncbi:unnamed protein product [Prunus armeniaca]|uniref:Uncharacterized protein n=1 Tax=Prunus armeniaca TaxID=36596 RepID=A0A6J5TGL2_PRUAR|nr:unnamed protein product [Prunus armeniaca]